VGLTALDADVAIIGAGPAGSSLACFLLQRGVRTLVLERDMFPRFHVGESLLTMCTPRLEQIGIDLSVAPYAKQKSGALFWDLSSGANLRIDFSHALPGTFPHAFQVERQYFDEALARRAQELGAELRNGVAVQVWSETASGVVLGGEWGSVRARYAIDATGQDALFGRRQRTVETLDRFGRCASFTTFGSVRSATARRLVGNGDIGILLVDGGWMWLIPLPGDRVSCGIVERTPRAGTSAEGVLDGAISGSPLLTEVFDGAECIQPYRRIANYSYYNRAPATARSAAVGDARAFLDPVFSSGVTIAIATAELLAERVARAADADVSLELGEYTRTCERAYATFDRLIERFYRPEWVRNVFLAAGLEDRVVREFTAILAGDVWRTDNAIQNGLLGSRPRGETPESSASR